MATDKSKNTDNENNDAPKVVPPSEVTNDAKQTVEATNKGVEKAGDEAAKRLEGQSKESFNTTDAVLGEDEEHGKNVAKAQAQSNGTEYKEDEEKTISPVPSQNQNNLKHPAGDDYVDTQASKNYLGQPI